MKDRKIYYYLDQIIDKPICDIGRASNMLWIGIGEIITVLDRKGQEVKKVHFLYMCSLLGEL